MKKFFVVVLAVVLAGCTPGGTEIIEPDDISTVLVGSVWAGETPREGDWLTITFKAENKVICSFAFDNTTNEWEFSFNSDNRGTITNPQGGWAPAPSGFTISGNTLTITNYGSHAGAAREFKRVRLADLTIADPVPFTPSTLAADLSGSVWAGNTPREGDWVTATFMADGKLVWSQSYDNTTNDWTYTWAGGKGTVVNPQGGWTPTTGEGNEFTISGNSMIFPNWGGHSANRELKRYK